jgi:uncharacterized protein
MLKQSTDLSAIIRAAKARYALDLRGIHGVSHWNRVRQNGLRVAEHTGANKLIVELFAFLHDCCREYDGSDSGHGERAAEFAKTIRGDILHLDDDDFTLLYDAISGHEHGRTRGDVTVTTCWDADRLDLGRVHVRPLAKYLCNEFSQRKDTIEWAYRRSVQD